MPAGFLIAGSASGDEEEEEEEEEIWFPRAWILCFVVSDMIRCFGTGNVII